MRFGFGNLTQKCFGYFAVSRYAAGIFLWLVVGVANAATPTASFQLDKQFAPPDTLITFDASGSTDSDGYVKTHEWTINDQAIELGTSTSDYEVKEATVDIVEGDTVTRRVLKVLFASVGEYKVGLTITDNDGEQGSAQSQTVTIANTTNKAPVACYTYTPKLSIAGQATTFDSSCSSDSDGEIVQYSWEVNGSPISSKNVEAAGTKQITFSSPGEYNVKLSVKDDGGLVDSIVRKVTVEPAGTPPTASFTATPTTGPAPLTVTLDDSGSSDSDGEIVDYQWEVNGVPTQIAEPKSRAQKTIQFTNPGSYIVRLTITDNDGLTGKQEKTITVQAGGGEATITPATHQFSKIPVIKESDTAGRSVAPIETAAKYHPSRVIVKFRDGIDDRSRTALRSRFSGRRMESLEIAGAELWEVDNVPKALDLQNQRAYSEIEYIEPDYLVSTSKAPNDPSYSKLWGMHNGSDTDIDAPEAWDVTTGGDFVCAVIDTGVDYFHPDLKDNIWTNPNEIANNGKDDDNNGFVDDTKGWDFANNDNKPHDGHNHGTHVAGTIAARGNNNVGVVGVNWTGKILPVKFLSDKGSGYTSDAIKAVQYVHKLGIRCSNNSWGGGGFSQTLYNAIKKAGNDGHLFLASAGNSNRNSDRYPSYPAAYDLPNIISVCASNNQDKRAYFSNYGKKSVDLCAPGRDIYSTLKNNSYGTFSGTSMAAPHVAGVASLLWSKYPERTALEIKRILMGSVDQKTALNDTSQTEGRLNAHSALQLASGISQVFTVKNETSANQAITSVSLSGTNAADFELHDNNCHGKTLAAGGSCTVRVSFAPKASGTREAVLRAVIGSQEVSSKLTAEGDALPNSGSTISFASNDTDGDGIADELDPVPDVAADGSCTLVGNDVAIADVTYEGTSSCTAPGRIITGNNVVVGTSTKVADVTYSAGTSIILQNGFKVANGSAFHAQVTGVDPDDAVGAGSVEEESTYQKSMATVYELSASTQPRVVGWGALPYRLQLRLRALENLASLVYADSALDTFVFSTEASLLQGDQNGLEDVYLYESEDDQLTLISRAYNGVAGARGSGQPRIDGNGDHVVFASDANLLANDGNSSRDIYIYATDVQYLERISNRGDLVGDSNHPDIATDNPLIVYGATQADGRGTVYAFDYRWPAQGSTVLDSVYEANANVNLTHPAISPSGRFVGYIRTSIDGECAFHILDLKADAGAEFECAEQVSTAFSEGIVRFSADGGILDWVVMDQEGNARTHSMVNPLK